MSPPWCCLAGSPGRAQSLRLRQWRRSKTAITLAPQRSEPRLRRRYRSQQAPALELLLKHDLMVACVFALAPVSWRWTNPPFAGGAHRPRARNVGAMDPPGVCARVTSGNDRDLLGDERFDGAEVECTVVRNRLHLGRRRCGLQRGNVVVPEFRHGIDVHGLRGNVRADRLLEDE